MSHQDYERSRELADTESFYSLLMAAVCYAVNDPRRHCRAPRASNTA